MTRRWLWGWCTVRVESRHTHGFNTISGRGWFSRNASWWVGWAGWIAVQTSHSSDQSFQEHHFASGENENRRHDGIGMTWLKIHSICIHPTPSGLPAVKWIPPWSRWMEMVMVAGASRLTGWKAKKVLMPHLIIQLIPTSHHLDSWIIIWIKTWTDENIIILLTRQTCFLTPRSGERAFHDLTDDGKIQDLTIHPVDSEKGDDDRGPREPYHNYPNDYLRAVIKSIKKVTVRAYWVNCAI